MPLETVRHTGCGWAGRLRAATTISEVAALVAVSARIAGVLATKLLGEHPQ